MPFIKTQKELAPILKMITDTKRVLGVESMEISQTTLEQVFIKVAQDQSLINKSKGKNP